MKSLEYLFEYKYLKQFIKKMSMYRICSSLYGFNLDAAWLLCNADAKKYFNWTFLERRQLFFELVAYNLEKKHIKFGGCIKLAHKPFYWNENTTVIATISYLEKGFCKDEDVFTYSKPSKSDLYGEIDLETEEGYKTVLDMSDDNLKINQSYYFFSYCPTIAYWHEKSQSWIWSND